MCNNFWENVYRVLVFIRNDIYNNNNSGLIKMLIDCIGDESLNSEMATVLINNSLMERNQLILQDGEAYKVKKEAKEFVLRVLCMIHKELDEKKYDCAYDMVDMLHVFPQVIIANDKRQIRQYWKIYVKPIMKKRNIKRTDLRPFKEGRV